MGAIANQSDISNLGSVLSRFNKNQLIFKTIVERSRTGRYKKNAKQSQC